MAGTSARRKLVGAVRIAALFAIIVGISGILVPALTRQPLFYLITFVFAVGSFVLLNPPRRSAESPAGAAPAVVAPAPEPVYIVDESKIAAAREEEKSRWANELAKSVDSVRRVKQELATSEDARAALTRNIEELTQTILGVRQQMNAQQESAKQQIAHVESRVAQLNAEREELNRLAAEREAEWGLKLAQAIEGLEGDQEKELQVRDRKIAEAQRALETERGIREQVANLARELQQQVNQSASAQGDLKRAMDQERAARERAESRIAELERSHGNRAKELDTERMAREQVTAIAAGHEREVAKVREELAAAAAEHERVVSRHQAEIDLIIQEREAARAEIRSLNGRLNELQDALDAERTSSYDKVGAARTETQELTARLAELQHNFEDERWQWSATRDDLSARVGDLQKLLDQERAEWNTKLQSIVAGMAADHENDIGKAIEEREAAKAEARGAASKAGDLQARLGEAQQMLARAIEEHDAAKAEGRNAAATLERERNEFNDKLQKIVSGMAADHESDIGRAIEEREAARAESRGLHAKLNETQHTLERERNEFNEKLQKIVTGIAADHENDIGEAMTQREAARAEARHLSIRVQELQRQIEDLKGKTVDETALRQKIDAEWSEKLQTIVAHLASDHDEDIGKAVEQKEEAKAEARTLSSKVASLQQQVERDRQMFALAEEKWNAMRDAMKKEIESLKSAPPPVPALPTPEPFPSPFQAVPPGAISEERARADVLEIAEQAHAVLKRTAPGTIPLPRDDRRTLILFVHHDPNMRTMWRDQLHKHGYDVIVAADGLDGLRVATAQRPSVVIADAQMPKMDGRELCRLLKTNEQTSSAKVILMSGIYGDESAGDGEKPDEVLRKPVKFDALQTALTNVLGVTQ